VAEAAFQTPAGQLIASTTAWASAMAEIKLFGAACEAHDWARAENHRAIAVAYVEACMDAFFRAHRYADGLR
jgi:hypothetical protein